MKNLLTVMTGAALMAATPALAQTAVPALEAEVGMKITGPNGGDVGVVDSMSEDAIVVDTGKNKAALPKTSFSNGDDGLSVTISRADLDAAVEQAAANAQAQLLAALSPGTEVKSVTGAAVIGTITESDAEFVTVDHMGQLVKLPTGAFAAKEDGVTISMTEAQFKAAISGT